MEKLIIKNFGPISDVEIELKKYTLLIGDTSTGKSIIAKLICIFQKIEKEGIQNMDNFKSLLKDYNIDRFLGKTSKIEYNSEDYFVKVKGIDNLDYSDELGVLFNLSGINFDQFENFLRFFYENQEEFNNASRDVIQIHMKDAPKIIDAFKSFKSQHPSVIYIPAERMFFSMLGNSTAGLWANNINVAKSYLDFAAYYEVAKKRSSEVAYPDLNFIYHNKNDKEYISFSGKKLDIKDMSSGIQAILPLIVILNYLIETQNASKEELNQMLCVEEPEISLFPLRQKELIEHIVSVINKIHSRIVITTHSPYILSAFNNLILANNAALENEDRKEEVEHIISKDKWIKYEEVSAYQLKDGKALPLLDEEYKNLDVNVIDEASDFISEQVDKLISIRYEA